MCQLKNFKLILLALFALSGCGGGTNGNGSTPADGTKETVFIGGQVIDAISGIPIENALIITNPPTESRLTDSDGRYELKDTVFDGEVYDVTARQVGYDSDTRRVTVSDGSFANADFSIETAVNGLVSSVSTLEIPRGESSGAFLLSSTLDNTPFSFTSSNPDFSASPSTGTLSKNEHMVIQVNFSPDTNQTSRVTGTLVGNTNNGGTGVNINLVGNIPFAELQSEADPFENIIIDTTIGTGEYDDPPPVTPDGPKEPTVITNSSQVGVVFPEFPEFAGLNDQLPVPATLGLNAPASQFAGGAVLVSWRNPDSGSVVRIARPDEPADVFFDSRVFGFKVTPDSRGTGTGSLNIPFVPGTFEIRMIQGSEILDRHTIEILPPLLRANNSGPSGSTVDIDIAGPIRSGSSIRLAAVGSPADDFFDSRVFGFKVAPKSNAVFSGTSSVPFTPGDYEIRLLAGGAIISSLPLKVTPATIDAQDSGVSGGQVDVTVLGPSRAGSSIRLAYPDNLPEEFFDSRVFGFKSSPTTNGVDDGILKLPFAPGIYEIRLISAGVVIATRLIEVTPPELSASESVPSGGIIPVAWSGPLRSGSFVRIARPGSPPDVFEDSRVFGFNISPDSSAMGETTTNVPFALGVWEIRIIAGGTILKSIEIEVTSPTLSGPASVAAGEPMEVLWAGPKRGGSVVRIAKPGDPVDVFLDRRRFGFNISPDSTGEGSNTIAAPSEPGEYEVRIIAGGEILNSYVLTVQ